ncbi:MAG: FIST C-terminal domain-containing protein [Deltaproteobacteria bacterium]|nr:FIST C-terminal domain-containing protein [Deltaproteobacteria bacterium]
MKMLNAHTSEADDPKYAVKEILEQLDPEKNLLANSAGFITSSPDFVETGIVKAICDALPFPVVGSTTIINANNNEAGTIQLTLTVLTADDCRFSVASSTVADQHFEKPLTESYIKAKGDLGGEPGLVLAFLPLLHSISGEEMLQAFEKASGGIPIFGTIACDPDTAHYSNSYVIDRGHSGQDTLALLLIGGNITPRFVVATSSEENLYYHHAVITSSEGSIIKTINGKSAKDYLTSVGLIFEDGLDGASAVPFIVDFNDGSQPVARAIYALKPDGSAVCGGLMPEGGTLTIGRLDQNDVLLTAEQSVARLKQSGEVNGMIMFSCLGRNMVLGVEYLAEIDRIRAACGEGFSWHMAYAGGEVCPVPGGDRAWTNRFHNYTFIGCAF